MLTTENLGLSIITDSAEDRQMLFSEWRARIAGSDSTSNMNLIDAAIGELREQIEDMGGESGTEATHFPDTGKFMAGTGSATENYAVAVGRETSASASGAFAEGGYTVASGDFSHAEGHASEAIGGSSHAEGASTQATAVGAHAEGQGTVASGTHSHAEGTGSTASGGTSHAEGAATTASGNNSHAEGNMTTAAGTNSHAEGTDSQANGDNSHAAGEGTIASHKDQVVFGRFNEADPSELNSNRYGTYVEIVGNGTSAVSGRSNARTLDWSGNEALAGDLTVNAGSVNEMQIGTAIASISEDVEANKAALKKVLGDAIITPDDDGYVNLSVATVDKDTPTADDTYVHAVIACGGGDTFLVNASGTAATGTWAFIDADGNVLLGDNLAGVDGIVERHNVDVTAPAESAYLIINHLAEDVEPSYKSFDISSYIDIIDSGVGEHFTDDNGFVVGTGTESLSDSQVVIGKYNVVDNEDTYAEIVGNGTGDDARSNARTLDWNGNEMLAGDLSVGGDLTTNGNITASGSLTIGGNVTVTANDMARMKRLSIEDGVDGLIIRL